MRVREQSKSISVHAVAGTEVILLGIDVKPKAVKGLIGFTIRRVAQDGKEKWLRGGKVFSDLPLAEGEPVDSRTFPIQAFVWGDYEVEAGKKYTYTVTAQYGKPGTMHPGESVSVKVETENPDDPKTKHGIYFNRGVAGSQAYARRFGKYVRYYSTQKNGRAAWTDFIKPDLVPGRAAWKWLSRGLEEAISKFIEQAQGERFQLRACVYEFDYLPVVQAFADALESGADVRIIHHSPSSKRTELQRGGKTKVVDVLDGETQAALRTIAQVGIKAWANTSRWAGANSARTDTTIAHNKFIVLLKDGKPIQVWTGSTNFTAGGIFGQSNVGHVIRDPEVAAKYLEYWEHIKSYEEQKQGLAADGAEPAMKVPQWVLKQQPDLVGPPKARSITPIFSPRPTVGMLKWYAEQLAAAKSSIHFTAAFGVSQPLGESLMADPVDGSSPHLLRYTMLESCPSKKSSDTRKQGARDKGRPIPIDYWDLIQKPWNRLAFGDILNRRAVKARQNEKKYRESLAGLNVNVDFLHTKYLLIDPLTENPTVISGSANFSDNSTTKNDENMLIIQGDKRVADIFLTEFMRLFNHFRNRNIENENVRNGKPLTDALCNDDSWTSAYFTEGTQEFSERMLFSGK